MSVIEQLHTSAVQVEGFREGLDRVRGVLDQTDALLSVADEVLIKADETTQLKKLAFVMKPCPRQPMFWLIRDAGPP